MTTGLFDGGLLLVRARVRPGTCARALRFELRGPDQGGARDGLTWVNFGAQIVSRDSVETEVDQVNRERTYDCECARSRLGSESPIEAERIVSVNGRNHDVDRRPVRQCTHESRMSVRGARFETQAISNVYNVRLGTGATSSPCDATARDAVNSASVVTR